MSVCRVALVRCRDAALCLKDRRDVLRQAELGPAGHHLGRRQSLVGNVPGVHAAGVGIHGKGGLGRPQVESTGLVDQLCARVLLDFRPGCVGVAGEIDITRSMVGQPDDSRVILRRTAMVIECELLQTKRCPSYSPGEPV